MTKEYKSNKFHGVTLFPILKIETFVNQYRKIRIGTQRL